MLCYTCVWFFGGGEGGVVCHVGSQFPDQGLNPCPLHWEHGVLTTGPPGKSLLLLLLLSHFSRVQLCATPEMATYQAPPSLGFSRQEHWSGWPFLSPMHESDT